MWIEKGHPIVNFHANIAPTRVYITNHINTFIICYSDDRFIPQIWRSEEAIPIPMWRVITIRNKLIDLKYILQDVS